MKRFALLLVIVCPVLLVAANSFVFADAPATAPAPATPPASAEPQLDKGDTAWMLMSTGLVLFMVPGLALFYGGMVRRKNVLGTMMQSMIALAIIGIQWVLIGYPLAFGTTHHGWIGWNPDYVGLNGVTSTKLFPGTNIPIFVHCMYQGMFAIITPALISGAIAERIRFGPYCLFILLWATLVYDPLAHWVWAVAPNPTDPSKVDSVGVLGAMGAIDFAGGTVVHIAAGFSGLAAILVLRKRLGYPQHAFHPNSMVLTLTGAGLLWFGWFGFNGGSALAANGQAGAALAASQVAAAAAALSWSLVEWLHKGKPTALGFASGLVAGLVAITPASGYVTPLSGLYIGLIAGAACYGMVMLKPLFGYDDSLDAFGVHGFGGFLGAVLTGIFVDVVFVNTGIGSTPVDTTEVGVMLKHGRGGQILTQLEAAAASAIFSFVVSLILVKVIDLVFGFTLKPTAERAGTDQAEHGEAGFDEGPALEEAAEFAPSQPRAATVPPNGMKRFNIVVEGPDIAELRKSWSEMCQNGPQPPPPEFLTVYPYLTTLQGNRFRFRGGEHSVMRAALQKLFENRLDGRAIHTHIEN